MPHMPHMPHMPRCMWKPAQSQKTHMSWPSLERKTSGEVGTNLRTARHSADVSRNCPGNCPGKKARKAVAWARKQLSLCDVLKQKQSVDCKTASLRKMDETDETVSGECICMLGLILFFLMISSQSRSPEKLQDVAKFPKG